MRFIAEDLGHRCISAIDEFEHVSIDRGAIDRLARKLSTESLDTPRWEHAAFPAQAGDILDAVVWLGNSLNFCYWVPSGTSMWGIEIGGRREVDAFAVFGLLHEALREGVDLCDGAVLRSEIPAKLFARGEGFLPLLDERVEILAAIGRVLENSFDGRLENAFTAAGNDALVLAEFLTTNFPSFRDVCDYKGLSIPLCKRAQLAAGMLHGARCARGASGMLRINRLTVYADYMIPVTLRRLGIFEYSERLADIVDNRQVMESGCEEESEIRIGTVAAGEMIIGEARRLGLDLNAVQLDYWLWRTGFSLESASPHHRVITTCY